MARLLLRTAHYTEGVVLDAAGSLFFSMTAPGTISRYCMRTDRTEVWAHVPAANGHALADDGTHVVMSSVGAVMRLDATGRAIAVVATSVAAHPLTYPNDVALDHVRGGFYFTDSGYRTMPAATPAHPAGRVCRVTAAGEATDVAAGLAYANGIALSSDGTRLFVGESLSRCIWTYAVRGDGTLGDRTLFAAVPNGGGAVPDGITAAVDDRIYVAHYGAGEVLVYDAGGTHVDTLAAGNTAASHVAVDVAHGTLYVSGGIESESGAGALFAVDR